MFETPIFYLLQDDYNKKKWKKCALMRLSICFVALSENRVPPNSKPHGLSSCMRRVIQPMGVSAYPRLSPMFSVQMCIYIYTHTYTYTYTCMYIHIPAYTTHISCVLIQTALSRASRKASALPSPPHATAQREPHHRNPRWSVAKRGGVRPGSRMTI